MDVIPRGRWDQIPPTALSSRPPPPAPGVEPRSLPTSATASPAGVPPRPCASPSSTCSRPSRGRPRRQSSGRPPPLVISRPADPPGTLGSLRRYSGLFGLLGVLLASLLIGLLVGHWLTGSPGTGKQVVEVKGLGVPLAAAGVANSSGSAGVSTGSGAGSSSSSSSSSHHSSSTSSQSHNASKSEGGVSETSDEEAQAAKEVKSTKALPAAHKTSSATLQKLEHTTGKQHAKEVKAALGNGPIETH